MSQVYRFCVLNSAYHLVFLMSKALVALILVSYKVLSNQYKKPDDTWLYHPVFRIIALLSDQGASIF